VSYRMAVRASVSARIVKKPKREYDGPLPSRADIKEERVFTRGVLYLTLTKRTEMGGKLRHRKFHNVYSSHNVVTTIQSRTVKWTGHNTRVHFCW
jgi:hypothetical protein